MKKISLLGTLVLTASLLSACAPRSSVGIIGGADGPTSIFVSGKSHAPALTAEEAITIALSHAGLSADEVRIHDAEYELDDGIPQYEVEFFSDHISCSYEIHAHTGEILSFEQDKIGGTQ